MGTWLRLGCAASLFAARTLANDLSLQTLLPRIQHQVAEYVVSSPNYTCTEIIQRFERPRRVKDFQIIDTVKLEIAVLNGTERFGWPGSSQFEDKDLQQIVGAGYGALTKGDFVIHARNIFLRDQATFHQPLAAKLGDREAIRLDYEVPAAKSNFEVGANGQRAVVGYKGSVWVDPETFQLLRIEIEAEGIPRKIYVRSAQSQINYVLSRFGDSAVLLPSSSQHTLRHASSVEVRSRIEFSGCRQYGATTNLSFGDAGTPASAPENSGRELRVAPGVVLHLRMTEPIDSATAAVGDAISAVTTRRVQAGPGTVLPAGTVVHGRIRKMERHFKPMTYFIVGLEFNELEVGDRRVRFFAEMEALGPVANLLDRGAILWQGALGKQMLAQVSESVPDIPGVGIFVITANQVRIAKGNTMTWSTKERPVAAQRP